MHQDPRIKILFDAGVSPANLQEALARLDEVSPMPMPIEPDEPDPIGGTTLEEIKRREFALGEFILNSIPEAAVAELRDKAFPELAAGNLAPGSVSAGIMSGILTFCRMALAIKVKAEATGQEPTTLWAIARLTTLDDLVGKHFETDDDRAAWSMFEARLLAAAF